MVIKLHIFIRGE